MNKLLVDYYDIRNKHDKLLKSLEETIRIIGVMKKSVSMFKRFVAEF